MSHGAACFPILLRLLLNRTDALVLAVIQNADARGGIHASVQKTDSHTVDPAQKK